MPTVALNLQLNSPRVYTGTYLEAAVLLDSADPHTVVTEFVAEVRGFGRTGWVNIHTDKIYETERVWFLVWNLLAKVAYRKFDISKML
jgi:hypothetical protein